MEEDAREKEVFVEIRVGGADRGGGSHHLGHVFHQSATSGVVIPPGGGGAAEAFPEFIEEPVGEGLQAWIRNGGAGIDDMIPGGLLFPAGFGISTVSGGAGSDRVASAPPGVGLADARGVGAGPLCH